jgi:hypothetical protein
VNDPARGVDCGCASDELSAISANSLFDLPFGATVDSPISSGEEAAVGWILVCPVVRRRSLTRLVVVTVAGSVSMLGNAVGHATSTAVSATPAPWTPYVSSTDSYVYQLVPTGTTMYVVGAFSQVKDAAGHSFSRPDLFAFDQSTGAVSSWAPRPNGAVYSAAVSADGASVYIGGTFTAVNGVSVGHLAKLSATTGAVDTSFKGSASGAVRALLLHGDRLLVGGSFGSLSGVTRTGFGSVNPSTGAAGSYLNLGLAPSGASVLKLAPSHGGAKVLAMGKFTSVGGQARRQIFMVDLGTTAATLDSWSSSLFAQSCDTRFQWWIRSANWSPDDSKVIVATTGYKGATLCDVAAMFPATGTNASPLWLNRTGCDSLYAVAATATTVYIGGHERWANNNGCDYAGSTAVSRPGVGAIDATGGLATSWNPTRSRGKGADDMQLTAQGLWIASDTYYGSYYCAGRYHPGICLFPYTG